MDGSPHMTPSKSQRLLDLMALLASRRVPLPVHRILEELPAYRDDWTADDEARRRSVRRKFERDKDELKRLGVPLETVDLGRDGTRDAVGYRIHQNDLYLPLLRVAQEPEDGQVRERRRFSGNTLILSEDEAAAALEALRRILQVPGFPLQHEARMALRKLTFDLDPALEPSLPVRILDRPGGSDPQGVLDEIMDAVHRRKRMTFNYHSIGRNTRSTRDVEPMGLLFQWGCWYLAAAPLPRPEPGSEIRLFRLDRMSDADTNSSRPGTPDFEIPDGFSLSERADRQAWELGPSEAGEEMQVRFSGSARRLALRNGWGTPEADGAVHTFHVTRRAPFLRWVLSLAGRAELVSPPDARQELARRALETAAAQESPE